MVLDNINTLTQEENTNESKIAKTIFKYIFKNNNLKISIVDLANLADVSQPSVSRFVKAMGCHTYKEMTNKINQEIPLYFGQNQRDLKESLDTLVSEIITANGELNEGKFLKAAKLIEQADKINITAIGGNQSLRVEIEHKLAQIGKNVMVTEDWHRQMLNLNFMSENDVLIAISYSGETDEVLAVVEEAVRNNINVIAITGNFESTLSKMPILKLLVPSNEGKYRTFLFNGRIISFILWEMIFEELVRNNNKYFSDVELSQWKNLK